MITSDAQIKNIDVSNLKGVGPKISSSLNRLKIFSLFDLIFHFPFRYQDRTYISKVSDLTTDSGSVLLCLKVKAVEGFSTKALTAQAGGQLVINMGWNDELAHALEEALNAEVEAMPVAENAAVAADAGETALVVKEPRRGFKIGTAKRRRVQDGDTAESQTSEQN